MIGFYLFTAIFGWAFAAFFIFFGGDADFDLDVDVDGPGDLDIGSGPGPLAAVMSFLSFRSLVFFAAFFGLTGLLLTWLDTNRLVTVLAAVGLGFFAMWLNRMLIQYLKATSSDSQLQDHEIAGSIATVVLPIGPGQKGRVAIEIAEQRIYLVARPFRPKDGHSYPAGSSVVVIEIEDGTALVAPIEAL